MAPPVPPEQPNEENDWGGVHTNCGVGHKLCYLLTDGDIFNERTVSKMDIVPAAKLFYECQFILPTGAEYSDLYYALIQASVNQNLSKEERDNIKEACEAVEICTDIDDLELVAHWKFDEGQGQIVHDPIGNNDGQRGSMPGADASDPAWQNDLNRGWCLDFDGENDYVDLLEPITALGDKTVTISAWIKAKTVDATYSPILAQWYSDELGNHGYYFCLNGNMPTFYLHDFRAQSDEAINGDVWYHLAGTYNSKHLKVYVDGVLKDTNENQDLADKSGVDTERAYIGSDGSGANYNYFHGVIDDLRVYNWGVDIGEIWDLVFGDTSKFSIKNSSGVRVAWFDDLGNLFLRGTRMEWQDPEETDGFILEKNSGPTVYIDDSGNLFLKGEFTQGSTPSATGADEFRIQDSEGDDVAIIKAADGSVHIKGKLYQNPEP